MPGRDGYELIRAVRSTTGPESLPAAALTAYARPEDAARAREAGFQMQMPGNRREPGRCRPFDRPPIIGQQEVRSQSAQGDSAAQNSLGEAYFHGFAEKQDLAQSYKWFSLAAAQGVKNATEMKAGLEKLFYFESLGSYTMAILKIS